MDVFDFHKFFSWQNLLPYNYFGGSACLTGCYHLKVPILRKKNATNSSTSTDPFSAATETFVLGNLFKLCKICHHIRTGSSLLGIMKRIGRICHIFLHLHPQTAIKFL